MSAAVSLPAFEWRSVAPEEWLFLTDLFGGALPPSPPTNDRPSDITPAPGPPATRDVSSDRPSGIVLTTHVERWSPPRRPSPLPTNGWLISFVPPAPHTRRRPSAPKWTDCGNPECTSPKCADAIACRAQAKHEKVTAKFVGAVKTLGEWLERLAAADAMARKRKPSDPKAKKSTYKRPSQAKHDKSPPPRVDARLTDEQRAYAQQVLKTLPVRRLYQDQDGGRREWTAAAWVELENPRDNVEIPTDLDRRIEQATWRGEWSLRPKPASGTPSVLNPSKVSS